MVPVHLAPKQERSSGQQQRKHNKENQLNLLETLKHYFGYDSLRPGQKELMDGILQGKDVLGIMPTGAGKSLCYQVPALMLEGITLVVSPLISLMSDQVKALNQAGVHAAYINSSLTETRYTLRLPMQRRENTKLSMWHRSGSTPRVFSTLHIMPTFPW